MSWIDAIGMAAIVALVVYVIAVWRWLDGVLPPKEDR